MTCSLKRLVLFLRMASSYLLNTFRVRLHSLQTISDKTGARVYRLLSLLLEVRYLSSIPVVDQKDYLTLVLLLYSLKRCLRRRLKL